ncbi:unnamed protein product [Schistosoma spindalis]|nr:unnamed protein product [Schistosoma spindale]
MCDELHRPVLNTLYVRKTPSEDFSLTIADFLCFQIVYVISGLPGDSVVFTSRLVWFVSICICFSAICICLNGV